MNEIAATSALGVLLREVSGIQAIVVASADGFALAQAGPQGHVADRLAAMTSSMLGLAGALGRELHFGELDTLILDATDGKVLMLAIPGTRPRLLMTACDHRCDGAAKRAGGSMQAVAVGIGACPGRVQQQCVDRSQAADDARRRPGSVATRRVACCVCG